MFNHSKVQKKPQNDALKTKDEHFTSTTHSDAKKTELLCGYLFDEKDNKLYAISGVCKDGELDLRKNEIKVGGDGILHWTAYLARTEEERQNPTPYSKLWGSCLGLPGLGNASSRTRTGEKEADDQVFNFSRSVDGVESDAPDVSIKKYAKSAVSEVSAHFVGDDLIVEAKATLFSGRTHVRKGGITNYLVNALRELINGGADQAIALLESKARSGEGTDAEPILL